MRCRGCECEMKAAGGYDECSSGEYAWNLYTCDGCGAVCRENVWANAGQVWVFVNDTVAHVPPSEVQS